MSIFEWLIEGSNPAPIGSVEIDKSQDELSGYPNWIKLLVLIVTSIFWYALFYALFIYNDFDTLLKCFVFIAIYLFIAFFIKPKPNRENIGFLGGLIDHPFRWSDDVNRMILILEVLLFPGKCLLLSFRILFFWFKKK